MIDAFSFLEDFGDGEKPWCDLAFEATAQKSLPLSKVTTVKHCAVANGHEIGFAWSSVASEWEFRPAEDDDSIDLWWGYITLSSIGERSDLLCKTWREYFELPGSERFAPSIKCLAVAIEGNPTKPKSNVLRTKLFFDNEVEEDYAEIFYNLDLEGGFGALNEKDPEYREPLLRWISGEVGHA